MKRIILFTACSFFLLSFNNPLPEEGRKERFAFTTLLTEGFESDEEGTNYRSNSYDDYAGIAGTGNDFWQRASVSPEPDATNNQTFTGKTGTFFWTGEDVDSPDNPLGSGVDGYVTLKTVDVSGYAGGTGKVSFDVAAEINGSGSWETPDFLGIEYAFDTDISTGANSLGAVPSQANLTTGSYTIAGGFYGSGTVDPNDYMSQDEDLDGDGDGINKLNNTFTNYSFQFAIPAGVSLMSVRVRAAYDAGGEVASFDNIIVSAEPGSIATTLAAGDLALATVSADAPDAFSFVSFVNIAAGTSIFFTDKGWDGSGSAFQTTAETAEGIIEWSNTVTLVAGTEVVVTNADSGSLSASSGTVSRTSGDFDLSEAGDQILVFQGTTASPTFVYAFNFDANGYVANPGTDATNTSVPTGLTEGTNAYETQGHLDNWQYRCSANATALVQYMQDFNYNSDDSSPYTLGVSSDLNCLTGPNDIPVATSISFAGILKTSATLTGAYTYSDGDSDLESGSTYKWYRANDISGTGKAAISGAISQLYVPQADDVGKFLSFEVTPVDGKQPGNAAESSLQGPIIALPDDGSFTSLFTDSFETDGKGSRYQVNSFLDGFDYFTRFDLVNNPKGLSSSSFFANYSGSDDDYVLGGEDLDEFPENPLTVSADGAHVYVVFKTLDVTNYRDGTGKVQLLLGGNATEPFRYEKDDFIKIEYAFDTDVATGANSVNGLPTAVANVDDGTYLIAGAFYGDQSGADNGLPIGPSGNWLEDTDLDGISSDEIGAKLSQTLSDHSFTFPIPATASNMSIRIYIATTDGSEEVIMDNVRISAAAGVSVPTEATVAATVFLEGAYNGTDLNTTLNASISSSQPYSNNGHAAGESASAPAGAVDWVLVELREAASAATALASTRVGSAAGFLMSDGSIKATDGTSNLSISLSGNTGSDFFVVVYHRNHLPIMSASALSASGTITVDFTSASAAAYQGTSAVSSLSGGKFGMIAGDADGDGDVDGTDLTTWRAQNGGVFSYNTTNGDFNLDGVVNAVDRNEFQKKNTSKTSQVPTT